VDPYSRDPTKVYGHVMDARQLVTLENLVGRSYLGTWCWGERDPNPHGQAAPLLIAEYLDFKAVHGAQLLAQTEYAQELDIIQSAFGSDAGSIIVNWDALQGKLQGLFDSHQSDRIVEIIKVLTDLGTYSPAYRAQRDSASRPSPHPTSSWRRFSIFPPCSARAPTTRCTGSATVPSSTASKGTTGSMAKAARILINFPAGTVMTRFSTTADSIRSSSATGSPRAISRSRECHHGVDHRKECRRERGRLDPHRQLLRLQR